MYRRRYKGLNHWSRADPLHRELFTPKDRDISLFKEDES